MSFPKDIGIVDCMIGFPAADFSQYDFIRAQLRDSESRDDFDFPGHCPFHGDCMEGLASGPAIIARWGAKLSDLPPDHPAHTYVAGYLAHLCHTTFSTVAVETIVLGGGVMQTPGLLDAVREKTFALGAEYLPGRSRQQIVAPKLGQDSGISGALQLAARAFEGAYE